MKNKITLAIAALALVVSVGCSDSKKDNNKDGGVNPNGGGNNQSCAETPNACVVGEQRAEGFYLASGSSDTELGPNKLAQIRVAFFGTKPTGRSINASMKGYLIVQKLYSPEVDADLEDLDGGMVYGGGDEEDRPDRPIVLAPEERDGDLLPLPESDSIVWSIITAEPGKFVRSIREVVDANGNEIKITSGKVEIKNIHVQIHGGGDHVLARFSGSMNTNFKNAAGFSELKGTLTFYRVKSNGKLTTLKELQL